ncbi:hypothetical protein DUZ99_07205 [Xylanibacillus composti]|uniref:Uncharacterized protein n=1 Tax=Xylanibacillus composti TaxID=1572762 RepID=A0A8J4H5F0_9BACL|nr:hypothetical protein [Xylanibacillus composti]MDT9724780.1 hypothetical protein [Xylanibacillus composti]GIQ69867.1 hypothetical protein XYCOK13_26910 [Xylanibacillus composti]
MDKTTCIDSRYLTIAIQSVLFHYRNRLDEIHSNNDAGQERLIKEMADEITHTARHIEALTDQTMRRLGAE